ncbi:hypothetical protein F5I97DRAFT_1829606 [Phlebopus sp. FC_14]|nr:hypothetical protein F5I97DRAFT_1829606 [Phlebopus sp. FC_14]
MVVMRFDRMIIPRTGDLLQRTMRDRLSSSWKAESGGDDEDEDVSLSCATRCDRLQRPEVGFGCHRESLRWRLKGVSSSGQLTRRDMHEYRTDGYRIGLFELLTCSSRKRKLHALALVLAQRSVPTGVFFTLPTTSESSKNGALSTLQKVARSPALSYIQYPAPPVPFPWASPYYAYREEKMRGTDRMEECGWTVRACWVRLDFWHPEEPTAHLPWPGSLTAALKTPSSLRCLLLLSRVRLLQYRAMTPDLALGVVTQHPALTDNRPGCVTFPTGAMNRCNWDERCIPAGVSPPLYAQVAPALGITYGVRVPSGSPTVPQCSVLSPYGDDQISGHLFLVHSTAHVNNPVQGRHVSRSSSSGLAECNRLPVFASATSVTSIPAQRNSLLSITEFGCRV